MPEPIAKQIQLVTMPDPVSPANLSSAFPGAGPIRKGAGNWISNNLRIFISASLRVADTVSIAAAAAISYIIRGNNIDHARFYFLETIIAILLTAILFENMGLYKVSNLNKLSVQLSKISAAYSGVAASLIMIDYLSKISDQISRIWSVLWFVLALAFLLAARILAWRAIRSFYRAGKFATSVAIVGSQETARRLIARLSPELGKTVNLVQVFDVEDADSCIFSGLEGAARIEGVDEVLIPLPWANPLPLEDFLCPLRNLPITVRLIPEVPKTTFSCLSFSEQCGLPAISVLERPLTGFQTVIKRAEDLVISSIVLLFFSPLMLLIALAIKLDSPGPVLFRQDRWGFNARKISILKFRTMRADAADEPTVAQATRDDKRVTRIGWFLRRTSLDELPQLINVLQGDMSLVGPRPHAVSHNELYMTLIDNYLGRHRVKPGITGLAQINGCRGITDTPDKMQERVNYDLRYIDSWSLLLDIKVMAITLFVGFRHKNAF